MGLHVLNDWFMLGAKSAGVGSLLLPALFLPLTGTGFSLPKKVGPATLSLFVKHEPRNSAGTGTAMKTSNKVVKESKAECLRRESKKLANEVAKEAELLASMLRDESPSLMALDETEQRLISLMRKRWA